MKEHLIVPLLFFFLGVVLYSCSNEEFSPQNENFVSQEILDKISTLGLSTEGVIQYEDGFLVEGDIHLTEEELFSVPSEYRVPQEEQYRTFNLVKSPRTIKVWVADNLDPEVIEATDIAMQRYNDEGLELEFVRIDKKGGADIEVRAALPNFGALAAAGFPTRTGKPYKYIRVNTRAMNSNANLLTMASVMAHEIGHCIGFRHTDWFNRSISCGGFPANEGEGSIGAVHIPGTPTGADLSSFMLSCIPFSQGVDRPFTTADKVALDYLY